MKNTIVLIILSVIILNQAIAQTDYFKPGRYYDLDGNKFDGFIDYKDAPTSLIQFKSTPLEDPVKIGAHRIKAVVIEADSFVTITKYAAGKYPNNTLVVNGLGQVLESGKVTLYKVHYKSEPYKVPADAFLLKQGSDKIITVEMDLVVFIKQMSKYFQASNETVEKIKNKEYSYFKIRELVKDFNALYPDQK